MSRYLVTERLQGRGIFRFCRLAAIVTYLFLGNLHETATASPASIACCSEYADAVAQATRDHKMLLLVFHPLEHREPWKNLLVELANHPTGQHSLANHVTALLPLNYATPLAEDANAKSPATDFNTTNLVALIGRPAFNEMENRPGLAVIDLSNPESRQFHHVVSVLPVGTDAPPPLEDALAILDLPMGSLTQRTLIFAVRRHPSHPHSANGQFSPMLAAETETIANYQATINLQGHHQWETRFHRINAKLPSGMVSQEVCAESWPNQSLLASARECVHSWSQSAGHWSAVSAPQPQFAYDMKRGSRGVWYGVGIFGKH